MERYDVAVIGLGAMGSAACAHLAQRGARTIGFEQNALGHDEGSSGGRSRIIRKAYFEDVAYVPLLERSYELWRELESLTQQTLLALCGVLVVDRANGTTIGGVALAARAHNVPIVVFDSTGLRRAYPQLTMHDDEAGILEPDAGVVFPEAGIAAHLSVARARGATLLERVRVRGWERRRGAIRVRYGEGLTIEANRVIVAAGAWTPQLIGADALPLQVQRNVQYWFESNGTGYDPAHFPAFFLEREGLPAPLYGMPDFGDGVKVALHGYGALADPDFLDRSVHETEVGRIASIAKDFLPELTPRLRSTKVCMYTNTPDAHFAIGTDRNDDGVILACGFSGHGYKFAPAIGEVLAQLALEGESRLQIGFLDPDRFLQPRSL